MFYVELLLYLCCLFSCALSLSKCKLLSLTKSTAGAQPGSFYTKPPTDLLTAALGFCARNGNFRTL